MVKIENRSKDTIKSYSFKLEKGEKSITKTEKDFPISETIEIKIDSDEIKKSKLESANAKLIIVYSNDKKHIVESSNLNFATTDINIITYGSAKKLNINTKNLLKDKKIDYAENQHFTVIQNLVEAYMEQHPVDVSKIAESQIKTIINNTAATKEELEAVKDTIKGKDGKSAYEQAVEGGYTGTEAKFKQALANIDTDPTDIDFSDIEGV